MVLPTVLYAAAMHVFLYSFRYLSIEIDRVDNHKKFCDPLLSISDICRLISSECDRLLSTLIDYSASKLSTCYVMTTVLLTNTDEEKKRHNKDGFHCSKLERSFLHFLFCTFGMTSKFRVQCVVWVYLTHQTLGFTW